MRRSILFYVQHLLGIGHLRRALHLVDGMAQAGFAVTLVSGGEPLPELASAAARRIVQLAPIRAQDASFRNLVGADGRPVDDALRAQRCETLLSAFAAADPDAVLIEAYPFGRRAFRFEIEPLIAAAHARRPRALVLSSLRDIVVAPEEEERRREIVARVRAEFDAVLVHGDPSLIPLEASFPLTAEVADRLVYTGYVAAPAPPSEDDVAGGAGEVLVSAGGGAMGGGLLRSALAARRHGCVADAGWRLLAGPNLPPAEFAELTRDLPAGVIVERYRADFPQLLRHCRVSVSQAGYNTVIDVLAAGARAVLVPFAEMRETEQTLRAERLAGRGVVEMVEPASLSPERLAATIERAVRGPRAKLMVDTAGARRTARTIAAMLCNPARGEAGRKFNMPSGDNRVGK
ncbi:MAG TPA: glycosyltransferase [Stellaceae bacterium]|nr:glycosyltransferase [Stellaceae bacterium]